MIGLYNRYINTNDFVPPEPEAACADNRTQTDSSRPSRQPNGSSSPLRDLLGGTLKLPEFNSDTLILLVIVYFLVAEADDKLSDTVLIIAALFLLGL